MLRSSYQSFKLNDKNFPHNSNMSSNAPYEETSTPKPSADDTGNNPDSSEISTVAPTPGDTTMDKATFDEEEKKLVESMHRLGSYPEWLRKKNERRGR